MCQQTARKKSSQTFETSDRVFSCHDSVVLRFSDMNVKSQLVPFGHVGTGSKRSIAESKIRMSPDHDPEDTVGNFSRTVL